MPGTPEKTAIALLTAAAALGIPACILDFEGLAGGAGPGACAACGLCQGACDGADCRPLAGTAGSAAPFRLALSGDALYAADPEGQAIVRLAPGGAPERLPLPARPAAIAADATHLVWSADGGGLYRCALPGCTAPVELAPAGADTVARQIALDAGQVYWLVGPDNDPARLMRCDASACAPEILADGLSRPHALALDGEHVYWTNHGSGGDADGSIERARKDGGARITYLEALRGPSGLALTATHAYFTVSEAVNAVYRCARGPDGCGAPEEVSPLVTSLEHPVSVPRSIAVAGDRIYWTNDGDATVMACPAAGCATTADGLPAIVALGQAAPSGIVAAEGCVFWAAEDGIFGAPRAPR